MSWVTIKTVSVLLSSVHSLISSSCSDARVSASSAPNGSSRSSTSGWTEKARATATRCFIPPEICAGRLKPMLPQPDDVQELLGSLALLGLGEAVNRRIHRLEDVVPDTHPGQEGVVLEHHAAVGPGPFDCPPAQPQLALGRPIEAGHQVEDRRLAAAGVADQAHDLAAGHVQRDVPHRRVRPVRRRESLRHAADLEIRLHGDHAAYAKRRPNHSNARSSSSPTIPIKRIADRTRSRLS